MTERASEARRGAKFRTIPRSAEAAFDEPGQDVGSTRKRRGGWLGDERGAAYVEFILCFPPLFVMFLGVIQLAMMYAANLVVRHAANTAARAAAVVIDDDPSRYGSEQRRQINVSTGTPPVGTTTANQGEQALSSVFGSATVPVGGPPEPSGQRLRQIRLAATVPLIAVTPMPRAIFPDNQRMRSLGSAIGFQPPEDRGSFAEVYNRGLMAVTFHPQEGSTQTSSSWPRPDTRGWSSTVTTRVTYLYHCGVPIVNRWGCEDLITLRFGSGADSARFEMERARAGGVVDSGVIRTLQERQAGTDANLRRWREGLDLLNRDALGWIAVVSGYSSVDHETPRFYLLQAEATLPVHAAGYCYGSDSGDCWQAENGP